MKTLTTNKGLTYEVDYAWAPLLDGTCRIQMIDDRPLSVIAPEFEGLSSIHYSESSTGEYEYDGYDILSGIVLSDPTRHKVEITLSKRGL